MLGGLPFSTYAPRGRGGQVSYTFPLRITCKKGGEGVQIACKIAYVLNRRHLDGALHIVPTQAYPLPQCVLLSRHGPFIQAVLISPALLQPAN